MLLNLPSGVSEVNHGVASVAPFASDGWQNRRVPLHVTHDRALAEAMARDRYPVVFIPPTKAGVGALMAVLASEPRREHTGDRDVFWHTPEGSAGNAARETRDLFDDANFSGTAPYYTSYEAGTWELADYEARIAPDTSADLAAWESEIAEARRDEQAEQEERAREKARRLEREETGAFCAASRGWQNRTGPLYITHDPAMAKLLEDDNCAVACIPATKAGVRALADLVLAEPWRPRFEDRQIIWLIPTADVSDRLDSFRADYDPDGSKERKYRAEMDVRCAATEMSDEFAYWTDPALKTYVVLQADAMSADDYAAATASPAPPPSGALREEKFAEPDIEKVIIDITHLVDWLGVNTEANPLSPHPLARGYLASIDPEKQQRLRFWGGEFWRWEGGAYRQVARNELRAQLVAWMERQVIRVHKEVPPDCKKDRGPAPVTRAMADNVLQALSSLCLLELDVEAPAWVDDRSGPEPIGILPMRNGLLNLEAVANGWRDHLLPPTPSFFSLTAAPFDFIRDAPQPKRWLKFLGEVFDGDQESVAALQEQFGLCLTPVTRHQKIMVWIGPTRSGKGTASRVLTELVGAANVANPTLSTLAGEFGLWPLIGKSLAILSDARLSGPSDVASAATERLLQISGEDAVTINRKGVSMLTMRLQTRFILISNELPKLGDASGALPNRFVILRFKRSFLGREDTFLTANLLAELPGVLKWAIAGWRRLQLRGRLSQPEAGKGLMQDMLDLSSPVSRFIRERCVVDAKESIATRDLYAAWSDWCKDHGRLPGVEQLFGRELAAAFPDLMKVREHVRDENAATKKRVYMYRGIRLRKPEDKDD